MAPVNLSTEQKQTHKHREQTCGCGAGGRGGEDVGGTGSLELIDANYYFIHLFIFCLFAFSRAAPGAYRGSQARG